MLKILTIIGARPQIIKAAALSRAIENGFSDRIKEIILHTGQHYDVGMSKVFFDELGIPQPDYNLNVGSGSHGKQTALMLEGIEEVLLKEEPNAVVVYGDTNSTLAGAVAASKLLIPIVHIEAGLRSFNKTMPEEINRIMCDHASTLLFSPSKTGVVNLVKEGFETNNSGPYSSDNPNVYHCGDVMYDNSLHFSEISEQRSALLAEYQLESGQFILSTIHRNNNTDEPERLTAIFKALLKIANESQTKIVLPLHPRTAKLLESNLLDGLHKEVTNNPLLQIIPPVSFLDMIALEKHANMIITDSGGVQKEAFFFQKPCIILRPETEWVELVENGNAIVVDADEVRIGEAYNHFKAKADLTHPPIYGDGKAAAFMCEEMLKHIKH
jgi:UDP-GlcNAc3NAcA epimerase